MWNWQAHWHIMISMFLDIFINVSFLLPHTIPLPFLCIPSFMQLEARPIRWPSIFPLMSCINSTKQHIQGSFPSLSLGENNIVLVILLHTYLMDYIRVTIWARTFVCGGFILAISNLVIFGRKHSRNLSISSAVSNMSK